MKFCNMYSFIANKKKEVDRAAEAKQCSINYSFHIQCNRWSWNYAYHFITSAAVFLCHLFIKSTETYFILRNPCSWYLEFRAQKVPTDQWWPACLLLTAPLPCFTTWIKWSLVFNFVHDHMAYGKVSTACSRMERCPVINKLLGVFVFCFFEKELKKPDVPPPGEIMKGGITPDTFWVLVPGMPQVETGSLDSFLHVTGADDQQQYAWMVSLLPISDLMQVR